MRTLSEFEQVSGLKVNKEKTKVVKIGVEGDNRMEMCTDLNLLWTKKFTALGVTYDVQNMKDISDQNIEIKTNEIIKLITIWSGRNITPLGKITVIKSLLISKITHILLSLPTPNINTIKKLESVFKDFIWNQKPPKFRKGILEAPCNLGGLQMTNILMFDKALKIFWLKRLHNEEDGWEKFPRHFKIDKIPIFGDMYPSLLIKNMNNPFWIDVAKACMSLQKEIMKENNRAYNVPLWFNSEIRINFRKDWYNQGYTKISDILDTEGKLFSINTMTNMGLRINFLDYEKLRFDLCNVNMIQGENNMCGPYLPNMLFKIGYNVKGCAKTYKLLMNFNQNIISEAQQKWETTLNEEVPYRTVERSFKRIQKMKEGSFVKYLQFKMLHKRIVTNKLLCEMALTDTTKCPFCEEPEETIEHAFLFCDMVKNIWREVEQWSRVHIDGTIKISNIEKIMGTSSTGDLLDKIIIATTRVIYRNRQQGKPYTLQEVQATLRSQMQNEEYQSSIEGTDLDFIKTWEPIYGIIY